MRSVYRSSAKAALSEWSIAATAVGRCWSYRSGCPECGTTNFGRSKHLVRRTRSSRTPVLEQAQSTAESVNPRQFAADHQCQDFVGAIRHDQHAGVPEQLFESHFIADAHRAVHA